MPVALPPGRLILATRPNLTGSSIVMKTMGIVEVAVLAASAETVSPVITAEISRQHRQPIIMTLRPAIFDGDILALDIACFGNAVAKCGDAVRER